MKSKCIVALILLFIIVLVGCNDNNDKIQTELIFEPGLSRELKMSVGEELINKYIMYKGIVDFKNDNVVFFSSDESIIRVDPSSQEFPIYTYFDIIAVSEGVAIIYAQNTEGSVVSEPIRITVTKNSETQEEKETTIESETNSVESIEPELEIPPYVESESTTHENVDTEPEQTPITKEQPVDIVETESGEENTAKSYILNINSKKFHLPTCSSAKQMKEENKEEYNGNRDELIAQGYSACKICKP